MKGRDVMALQVFSKGFLVCSRHGYFALWVLDNSVLEEQGFVLVSKWKADRTHDVIDFTISHKEGSAYYKIERV